MREKKDWRRRGRGEDGKWEWAESGGKGGRGNEEEEAEGRGEAMPNPKQWESRAWNDWWEERAREETLPGQQRMEKETPGSTDGFLLIWRNGLHFKVKENKNKKRGGEKEEEREGLREEGRKRSWQAAVAWTSNGLASRNLWWQTWRVQHPGDQRIGMSCLHNAPLGSDC